ncbi:uncharacterized protein [Ptychodera flava]|uniref:uncharacterized protein isoform X2 n=1 Tax=Ptychodera flava TaxID=63121 RepID=UPI00396A165A
MAEPKSDHLQQWTAYRSIKAVHENSRGVFPRPMEHHEGFEKSDEDTMTLYSSDFCPKKVKPVVPRPCSVTRRNNPHPSQMFMHWKVPTRLIKPESEYKEQQQTLIRDSNQKFYEDINGKREEMDIQNDVLKQTEELYKSHDKVMEHLNATKNQLTSTTHHSPPYHMFPTSPGKDHIPSSATISVMGSVRGPANGSALPAIIGTPLASNLDRKKSSTDLRQTSVLARSIKPKAQPAAEKWLKGANDQDKKVVDEVLRVADKEYVDKTLNRTLQPDAKKAVERWMEGATSRDRDVAIQFFGSLAGTRLMGMKDNMKHEDDSQCKICDGDRLREVLDTLNSNKPVGQRSHMLARRDPGAIDPAKRRAHLRLLTPNTRATKPQHQTWHHLPMLRHPGPVSNTIAMFTRPHRAIPRHFTIHPEWE